MVGHTGIAVGVAPEQLLGPLNDVEEKYAPTRLYCAGDPGVLWLGPRVSVIGSRKASAEGLKNARVISESLVAHGVVVVSGLAEGIDRMAHETALRCGGRTIAVLGTPLTNFYPPSNRALQVRIMREHLAISQFAPGTPFQKRNFPIRNRTMALISHASIIVEAANKSGTLHQGWEALRLGRPLFILEAVVNNPELGWPAQMIEYGAVALTPSEVEWVLDEIPLPGVALTAHAAV